MNFERKMQFITGMVLGDGCITVLKNRPNSLQLSFKHCERQKDYLIHKRDLLASLYSSANITPDHTITRGKPFTSYRFRISKANDEVLTELRNELYGNGKRKFAKECTWNRLDAEGLAFLYMDNGSLGYVPSSSKVSKIVSANLVLALCYPLDQAEMAASILNEKFGVNFKTYKEAENSYSLRLATKCFEKFKSIVEPYFVPCMAYKIRSSSFHECGTSGNG
jgi:hypothetical protein